MDQVAARLATRKIVAAVARSVREIAARPAAADAVVGDLDAGAGSSAHASALSDPSAVQGGPGRGAAFGDAEPGGASATSEGDAPAGPHPLRLRFDAAVEQFIARLKDDPDFRQRGEALREQLIAHPALADYVHGLWGQLLAWLQDDLDRPDSAIGRRIAVMAGAVGERLRNDAAMRRWIDEQIEAAAPRAIDRYRDDIRRYIVERVAEWNAEEMTGELERNIGRDLQFIRINGTLVGGLVGLAIHALTQALR
ncbi:MAG: DUF445 domain-containing protein [Comamonadaceae bacterium]|nr:MAG: DUF445 domain-containing protein [Comamonadaceae bacterium]